MFYKTTSQQNLGKIYNFIDNCNWSVYGENVFFAFIYNTMQKFAKQFLILNFINKDYYKFNAKLI